MAFKKLKEQLLDTLTQLGYESPLPFQKTMISTIKSGANAFGIAENKGGKTTALIIGVIQRLQAEAKGDNPRALIFVENKKQAFELEESFKVFLKNTDLRIYTAVEEGNVNHQKDAIYLGCDILIATPKRLNKLYFLNGVNITELMMLIVEDAEFLVKNNFVTEISRITESAEQCQYLVFSSKMDEKLKRLQKLFMYNAKIIK
jgi:superfamily II DNA/RNA helicase